MYFISTSNYFLTDSDNSDAQDGPSDSDFWKGPLQEADEKSRLVWSSELVAVKHTVSIQNWKGRDFSGVLQWIFWHVILCQIFFHIVNLSVFSLKRRHTQHWRRRLWQATTVPLLSYPFCTLNYLRRKSWTANSLLSHRRGNVEGIGMYWISQNGLCGYKFWSEVYWIFLNKDYLLGTDPKQNFLWLLFSFFNREEEFDEYFQDLFLWNLKLTWAQLLHELPRVKGGNLVIIRDQRPLCANIPLLQSLRWTISAACLYRRLQV